MSTMRPADWTVQTWGILFFDLKRFCERAAADLEPAGATWVKLMGDGGLCAYEPRATAGILDALQKALFAKHKETDTWHER